MRDIRFRAWLPISKEMVVFGLPHINYEYGVLAMGTNQEKYSGIANMPDDYKQAVFMQFTGLLDKNGKEIYEGDIVQGYSLKTGEKLDIGAVEWLGAAWGYSHIMHNRSIEVIGNIYQDEHLLKE